MRVACCVLTWHWMLESYAAIKSLCWTSVFRSRLSDRVAVDVPVFYQRLHVSFQDCQCVFVVIRNIMCVCLCVRERVLSFFCHCRGTNDVHSEKCDYPQVYFFMYYFPRHTEHVCDPLKLLACKYSPLSSISHLSLAFFSSDQQTVCLVRFM